MTKGLCAYGLIGLSLMAVVMAISVYQPDLRASQLKARYSNEHSAFVNIDGMEVHYRVNGTGPVVLLVHGTGASLHAWDGWAEVLAETHTVIRLDLPAFGLTGPHPERNYTINSYVSLLRRFLDELEVTEVHLAGNSLGGGIAWSFALAYPDAVRSLVLIDSAGFPSDARPWVFSLAQNALTAGILTRVAPVSFMRKNLQQVYFNDSKVTDALVERYRELSLFPGNRQAFVDRVNTPMQYEIQRLAELSMPVFIMWGEQDTWIPVDNAHQFHRALPHSQLIVYPQLGHVPMEEAPRDTVGDALAFLLTVERSSDD